MGRSLSPASGVRGLYFLASAGTGAERGTSYRVWQTATEVQVYENANNVATLRASFAAPNAAGQTHSYGVRYDPTTGRLTVQRDEVTLGSWLDPTPLSSGAYLALRAGGARVQFANVAVADLVRPRAPPCLARHNGHSLPRAWHFWKRSGSARHVTHTRASSPEAVEWAAPVLGHFVCQPTGRSAVPGRTAQPVPELRPAFAATYRLHYNVLRLGSNKSSDELHFSPGEYRTCRLSFVPRRASRPLSARTIPLPSSASASIPRVARRWPRKCWPVTSSA